VGYKKIFPLAPLANPVLYPHLKIRGAAPATNHVVGPRLYTFHSPLAAVNCDERRMPLLLLLLLLFKMKRLECLTMREGCRGTSHSRASTIKRLVKGYSSLAFRAIELTGPTLQPCQPILLDRHVRHIESVHRDSNSLIEMIQQHFKTIRNTVYRYAKCGLLSG